MTDIALDGRHWRAPDDFYTALFDALGAPDWHGRNLDALADGLADGVHQKKPPYHVVVRRPEPLPAELKAFLHEVETVFEDAREDQDADVSIAFDPPL